MLGRHSLPWRQTGHQTKTRERTESAVKVVQAMHEDSFSANRVDPDPICSTSFGVKDEPPALPCRDDVVVENGAAAPKSCLSPLEMLSTTAAGGLLPTGETSTATSTTFDHSTLWFSLIEETILMTSIRSTSYDSSFWNNNLLAAHPARGSLKQNRGKIGCSIQAALKVVSTPARFWERGARAFWGGYVVESWMRLQRF